MSSPINFTRCKIIRTGADNDNKEVGYGSRGQLTFVGQDFGTDFIVKPIQGNFKFYRLIDGVQKLITVCDSHEIPYLTMMKENKNSIQQFQVKSTGDEGVYYIQCEIKGQEQFFTVDEKKIVLSAENSGNDSQKWKLQPC